MVVLHFRLTDENKEMLISAINWIQSVGVVYYAVSEISKQGKLHIHAIIDVNNKSTFIQQFHKHFKNRWHGNKSYSCEALKKDLINNYIYLSKGTRDDLPNVIHKIADITDENIKEYHDKYWEDKPKELEKTVMNNAKKASVPTWSELLTLEIIKQYPNKDWEYNAIDIDLLWSMVTKSLGTRSKKLNAFIVRDLVLGQLNALNPHCYGIQKSLRNQAFADLYGEA